jgi:dolichol kinase
MALMSVSDSAASTIGEIAKDGKSPLAEGRFLSGQVGAP